MKYVNFPKTSLKVSAVSLGTMMFGGQTSESDSLAIMNYAFEQGINFLDTANNYNDGNSEHIVGKGLKGRREKVILATKVFAPTSDDPNDAGLSRRNIINAIDASLRRLDTDYIDIYYLHSPDYKTSIEETMNTMDTLVKTGKIRYIGISNFAAWQISDILAICEKRNYVPPVVTENVLNLISRSIESELIPFLKAHPMALTVYNPLAGGLLSGKHTTGYPNENTRFFYNKTYYDRYWSDKNFTAIVQLKEIAKKNNLSLLQLALKWCASQPFVTSIIIGTSRLEQLKQNLMILDGLKLDEEVLASCNEIWHSLGGTYFAYNR